MTRSMDVPRSFLLLIKLSLHLFSLTVPNHWISFFISEIDVNDHKTPLPAGSLSIPCFPLEFLDFWSIIQGCLDSQPPPSRLRVIQLLLAPVLTTGTTGLCHPTEIKYTLCVRAQMGNQIPYLTLTNTRLAL